MPTRMRKTMHASGWHRAWLAVCFVLALSSSAMAQDYPSRTIKMIVPTGAGGVTDILARLVGNTPRPIIDKLNRTIVAALKTPEIDKFLVEQGLEPAGNSPEEFAKVMHTDIEQWLRVTHEAGIKLQ